ACGWNSDTQCQSCPAGFWSAQSIDNVKCIPCQSCGKDQVLVKQCSPTSDTLCCPLNNPNCTHELSMYFGKILIIIEYKIYNIIIHVEIIYYFPISV
ncbi:unnamed protein product, partial [Schistosoma curassoni]|uniref:TNFR-Cys domain-containing protein n=1 Tax=Schistosoma curassoni TaxID=6186 RepID=A0A183L4K9_9TREM